MEYAHGFVSHIVKGWDFGCGSMFMNHWFMLQDILCITKTLEGPQDEGKEDSSCRLRWVYLENLHESTTHKIIDLISNLKTSLKPSYASKVVVHKQWYPNQLS